MSENIVRDRNVTICTTTHTHTSHVTVNFYIGKKICTSLSRLRDRFHQSGSLPPWVKMETSRFKNKFQFYLAVHTLGVLSCHQRNLLFILFYRYLENYIEYFLLQSNIPTLTHNHYILFHATAHIAYYLFIHYLQVLPN